MTMKGAKPELHGLSQHPLYFVWKNMIRRCSVPTTNRYARYGGRGIKVCDEWASVSSFISWAVSNGWEQGLQLDRINNDGHYSPDNCKFVTVKENTRKRCSSKLTACDVSKVKEMLREGLTQTAISKQFNVSNITIHDIAHGKKWSDIQ